MRTTYDLLLVFYSNYSAIWHGKPCFSADDLDLNLSRSPKVNQIFTIRSATYDLLLVFNSNYNAIWHGTPVFQQMTLIWPFKVTKGQTDCAIWFATYDLLLVFYSYYSAISHGNPAFSADDLDLTFQGHQRSNWLCHPIRDLWLTISVV